VISPAARERFLREERGFTLAEMMVTMMVMIVFLCALYSVFDMSLRAFSFGNNKVEAVGSARIGLEKMEREIRAAYPVDASNTATAYLFFNANGSTSNPPQLMPTASQITFGNERGAEGAGNEKIDCLTATTCEYITYKLTDDASNVPCTVDVAPCSLRRVNTSNAGDWGDPVVENVAFNGLSFTYLKSDGTAATSEGDIRMVIVTLVIRVDRDIYNPATQRLTTVIDLRNR
jgi:prepilin-type N-terminal cleavage/methylation domain-containing protein